MHSSGSSMAKTFGALDKFDEFIKEVVGNKTFLVKKFLTSEFTVNELLKKSRMSARTSVGGQARVIDNLGVISKQAAERKRCEEYIK